MRGIIGTRPFSSYRIMRTLSFSRELHCHGLREIRWCFKALFLFLKPGSQTRSWPALRLRSHILGSWPRPCPVCGYPVSGMVYHSVPSDAGWTPSLWGGPDKRRFPSVTGCVMCVRCCLFVCFFNFFKFFTDFVISALSSSIKKCYNPRQKLVNVRQMQPGL